MERRQDVRRVRPADTRRGKNQLLHLLPGWKLPDRGIYAVFPAAAHRPQKIRAFVEALKAHVAEQA